MNLCIKAVFTLVFSLPGLMPLLAQPAVPSGRLSAMIPIPTGAFLMGSPDHERFRRIDETQHYVQILRPFALQSTEVTQSQWEFVRLWAIRNGYNDLPIQTPRPETTSDRQYPVTHVSWFDAVKWLNAKSEMEELPPIYKSDGVVLRNGRPKSVSADLNLTGYRLPTESEFEFSSRAKTSTEFYTGPRSQSHPYPLDPLLDQAAWYWGNSDSQTQPVGQKRPNSYGLYDTIGNVWEWCHDWYGPYPKDWVSDPEGPPDGSTRVFRGGGWQEFARTCRVANRAGDDPGFSSMHLGFRPARSIP